MIIIHARRALIASAIACSLASCSSSLDVDTPRSKEYVNPAAVRTGMVTSSSITFAAEENGRTWNGIPAGAITATIDTASASPRLWISGVDLSAITAEAVTRTRFRCDSLIADGAAHPIVGDPTSGMGMSFDVMSNTASSPAATKIAGPVNTVAATLTHAAGGRRIIADIQASLPDVPGTGITTPFRLLLTIDY